VAIAQPSREGSSVSLGEAAARATSVLDDAGYVAKHWYPIGARCAHGFAVTTRLEKMEPGGGRLPAEQRWSTLYPDPITLSWLRDVRRPRLPGSGRYRAYLIAFSDLHVRERGHAPRLDLTTLMETNDRSVTEFPAARRVPSTYRFGAYLYAYAASGDDGDGALLAADDRTSATLQVRLSGLGRLLAAEPE
jgi:hypothetical protein